MKKMFLTCSAILLVAGLAVHAAPLAGQYQINPPGGWAELLQGGQPGKVGNAISAGDGVSYLFAGAQIAEVQADVSGEWDWLTKYTGGTLSLSNVPVAPWFTPCDSAKESMVAFPEVWVKTRSTRFASTNAGYLEFELTGASGAYGIQATYAGMPAYTLQGTDILASGTLTSAAIRIGERVAVDIIPNPLNLTSRGVLPVAILGSADLDVKLIDPATIALECVAPLRWAYEDVSHDGIRDLTLKFDRQAIIANLPPVKDRDVLPLILTGQLKDGTPIAGSDDVTILKPGKKPKDVPTMRKVGGPVSKPVRR